MAHVCNSPATMLVKDLEPPIATGVTRSAYVLSPTCPCPLAPQQYAVPTDVREQVCESPAPRLVKALAGNWVDVGEAVIVEDGTEVGDALAVAVLEVVGVGVEVVDGDGVALEVLDAV